MPFAAVIRCLLIASLGCTTTSDNTPALQPATYPRRITTPPALTFSSPAARYNEPPAAPPSSAFGDTLLAKVREVAVRAGRPIPIATEGLFIATTALASVVPEDGLLSYPLVAFAFQSNGVTEPSPHLLIVWGSLDDPRGIANTLQPQMEQIFREMNVARVGIGAVVRGAGNYGAVAVAFVTSRIRMSPIPRALTAAGVVELEFEIERGRKPPKVWFTTPSGLVESADLHSNAATTFASIECGGTTGMMQVEVTESGEVLARFPVWCGVDPPRTFTVVPNRDDVPEDPAIAERQVFDGVNRERVKLGRAPFVWDALLAKSAREHSLEMQRTNIVASPIPGTLTVDQRVRAIRPDVVTRTSVARTYGVRETLYGLLNSPSVRDPLMTPAQTQIGIGIVYGRVLSGGKRELNITLTVALSPPD